MSNTEDITGFTFGQLTAVARVGETSTGVPTWEFLCSCGEPHIASIRSVKKGDVYRCKSCRYRAAGISNKTHGYARTKEYRTWCWIKERCYRPNHKSFDKYGAIGLCMDDLFVHSFEAFLAEVGPCPITPGEWSMGRKDNDLGYVVGNIGWETRPQQARNKGKQKNNKSGVTGVYINNKHRNPYISACWYGLDGKLKTKSFSVKKWGHEEAFSLACEHRKKMIEELNLQNAGYSEKHGL